MSASIRKRDAVVAFSYILGVTLDTCHAFAPMIYPSPMQTMQGFLLQQRELLPNELPVLGHRYPKSMVQLPVAAVTAIRFSRRHSQPLLFSSLNDYDGGNILVEADDLEALQALFAKYCDADGLLTKQSFMKIPLIADLLNSGDLLLSEFTEIFDRAPMFPEAIAAAEASFDAMPRGNIASGDDKRRSSRSNRRLSNSLNTNHVVVDGDELQQRIDVDSFVQIYRDIDDLFETDEFPSSVNMIQSTFISDSKAIPTINPNAVFIEPPTRNDINGYDGESDESLVAELQSIFESLCDEAGFVSKEQLLAWDEVTKLFADGLLGSDELENIWNEILGGDGAEEKLDMKDFLRFNDALDNLFVFDDDEMDDIVVPKAEYETDDAMVGSVLDASIEMTEVEPIITPVVETLRPRMIDGSDLEPDVLFVALANGDGLVGLEELKLWGELQEIISDGDLLESELLAIYKKAPKSERDLNKLEQNGFLALYDAIDNLFEDDDDDDDEDTKEETQTNVDNGFVGVSQKEELLDAITDLNVENALPCGLEATELEQREILSIVAMLEDEPSNLIRSKQGAIAPQELSGTWELLYSSSSAMKFNKGLSGLGGSVPNGRFGSLKQTLVVTKQLTDVEYVERIEMNPSSASFDVTVSGTWDLRISVSLFTGEPSIVMNVVPDRVTYGPTSTRADHWKSLGPLNMLDITYLDENLRVMRGNTSVDTIFVFRRMK